MKEVMQTKRKIGKGGVPLGKRLKHHLMNWRYVTRNGEILKLIEDGLKMAFNARPTLRRRSVFLRCPPHGRATLVQTLKRYLEEGIIEEIKGNQKLMFHLFFPIPKPNNPSTLRWLLDCRALNILLAKRKFKIENIETIRDLLFPGAFLTSIDVKDAFHHININHKFRRFLAFRALGRNYRWRTLPMGLTSSPFLWTALLQEVVKKLREEGICLSFYMDDLIVITHSAEESNHHTERVVQLMTSLGLTVNLEKSSLVPSTKLQHLGFILDTAKDRLRVPQDKIRGLAMQARKFLSDPRWTIRKAAQVLGKMNSMAIAIPTLRWRSKNLMNDMPTALQRQPQKWKDWDASMTLLPKTIRDLKFLCNSGWIKRLNGVTLTRPRILQAPVLTTDASPTGWGATLCLRDLKGRERLFQTSGVWMPHELTLSSNAKELTALKLGFLAFRHLIGVRRDLIILTDNTCALSYLKGNIKLDHLFLIAKPLIDQLLRRRIRWFPKHIPGPQNVLADRLSRRTRCDHDWSIRKQVFQQIQDAMGPFTLDAFADRTNHQIRRYCSLRPDPGAVYIDALLSDWSRERAYLCPPFPIISKVIYRIEEFLRVRQSLDCTLVVPRWEGSPWWPRLMKLPISKALVLKEQGINLEGSKHRHPLRDRQDPPLLVARIQKNFEKWPSSQGERDQKELTLAPERMSMNTWHF